MAGGGSEGMLWEDPDGTYDFDSTREYGLPAEILDRAPTNKEIASIAQKIGKEYQQLLTLLGLSKAEIEQCQIDKPHSMVDQTRTMLIKWRDRSESATFRELAIAMTNVDINTSDMFKDIK